MRFQVPGKEGEGKYKPVAPGELTLEPYKNVEEAIREHIPQIAEGLEKLMPGRKIHTVDIVLKIENWSFEEESE